MGKNNNKLLSLFLLTSISIASLVAGILSISKERYERSDATVTSYKTVYLYVPNPVAKYGDADPEKQITWDAEESNVMIRLNSTSSYAQMTKIQDHLFAYTLSNENSIFWFKTTINSADYFSPNGPSGSSFNYSDQSTTNSLLQMDYYGYSSTNPRNAGRVGNWYNPAAEGKPLHSASAYANAFVTLLRNDPCKQDGSSEYLKVKDVWKGSESIYSGLSSDDKSTLATASIVGADPVNEFAALYDHIYHKYGNYDGFGTNFVGRSVTPLPASKYVTSSFNSGDTTNIVISVSIGATSVAIVSLYFFIKKRKEDK